MFPLTSVFQRSPFKYIWRFFDLIGNYNIKYDHTFSKIWILVWKLFTAVKVRYQNCLTTTRYFALFFLHVFYQLYLEDDYWLLVSILISKLASFIVDVFYDTVLFKNMADLVRRYMHFFVLNWSRYEKRQLNISKSLLMRPFHLILFMETKDTFYFPDSL